MKFLIAILAISIAVWLIARMRPKRITSVDLSVLPPRFIIFDLETTGLDSERHFIIEIGAIRVNRDSDLHETFQALIEPRSRITAKIRELTGITREMLEADGLPIHQALAEFRSFVGDLPMVAFNADFDKGFLAAECRRIGQPSFANEVHCALKLSRRAWPGRKSYRLSELAKDGNLSMDDNHRALGDCRRTMIVYAAAARRVGSHK